jgi:hypothetical protein
MSLFSARPKKEAEEKKIKEEKNWKVLLPMKFISVHYMTRCQSWGENSQKCVGERHNGT